MDKILLFFLDFFFGGGEAWGFGPLVAPPLPLNYKKLLIFFQ
jgi:hypothetical protein